MIQMQILGKSEYIYLIYWDFVGVIGQWCLSTDKHIEKAFFDKQTFHKSQKFNSKNFHLWRNFPLTPLWVFLFSLPHNKQHEHDLQIT